MPRPGKGARLWHRPARPRSGRTAAWVVLDNGRHIATGCVGGSSKKPPREAEEFLAKYIVAKFKPSRKLRDIDEIDVADALSIYLTDQGERVANLIELERRIGRLNDFWGGRKLSDVRSDTCREYVKKRGKTAAARRELEDLRAAINHHAKENLHSGIVRVTLPPKSSARTRWLTRDEAARLLRVCWRYRETQTVHRGSRQGAAVETAKFPLRHVARFILIGLYTGTRASAIAAASPYATTGHSHVDLEQGIFYRLAIGKHATKKRQPPVPIPGRLLAHMTRWRDRGIAKIHFVEWNGKHVTSIRKAFKHAVQVAKLEGGVTPHTLRHTAATWLMQRGVDLWQAAGFLGMSVETLERNYGHHHPTYMQEAARAIGYGRGKRVSLAESLAERSSAHSQSKKIV
jgi:integrase